MEQDHLSREQEEAWVEVAAEAGWAEIAREQVPVVIVYAQIVEQKRHIR